MLLSHLYGEGDEPEVKIIDVFICKLRKKASPEATGGSHHLNNVGTRLSHFAMTNLKPCGGCGGGGGGGKLLTLFRPCLVLERHCAVCPRIPKHRQP